jgi:Flp pilus assembly protein TadD
MTEDDDRAPLTLATHYCDIDRPERALEVLERHAGAHFGDTAFWSLRARALASLDRHQDAEAAARRGLEIDATSLRLRHTLALILMQQSKLVEAERMILGVLAEYPENATYLCVYAQICARSGLFDKAARLVDEAARLDPEDDALIRTRLLLAHLRGDDKTAAKDARKLLSLDPEDASAHLHVGASLARTGDMGGATRHMVKAARLDPGDKDYVEIAREARVQAHWLLYPLRPLQRLGTVGSWFLGIGGLLTLRSLGYHDQATLWINGYLLVCVYSWIAPPLLRRWLKRKRP